MEQRILHKVQKEQLLILKEIRRVCDENGIKYFLDSGTLIGAVRHQGFIPWDDDIDIGMTRENYDKFSNIAPKKLSKEYLWQTWNNDDQYAIPFGKVRKRNTVFLEEKASKSLNNNGFYVDVFPFDYAPNTEKERKTLIKKRVFWARCLLMKHGYQPWREKGTVSIIKEMGFIPYRIIALSMSHSSMVSKYENAVRSVPVSEMVYEQIGKKNTHYYQARWLMDVVPGVFENDIFSLPVNAHERLAEEYGDYMKLPPESQRENRHEVSRIVFSDGEEYVNEKKV